MSVYVLQSFIKIKTKNDEGIYQIDTIPGSIIDIYDSYYNARINACKYLIKNNGDLISPYDADKIYTLYDIDTDYVMLMENQIAQQLEKANELQQVYHISITPFILK